MGMFCTMCNTYEVYPNTKVGFRTGILLDSKLPAHTRTHTFRISSSSSSKSILPSWSSLLLIHSREMTVRMLFNINIFEATCHFTLYPFITSTMTSNWINQLYFASPPACARVRAFVCAYGICVYSAQRKPFRFYSSSNTHIDSRTAGISEALFN